MSDVMDKLAQVVKEAQKGEPWEIGDEEAFILNDAVVIVSLDWDENDRGKKKLNVKAICGKPKHLDINLNMIKERS